MCNTNKNFIKAKLFGFDCVLNGDMIYRFKLKNNKPVKIQNNDIIDEMFISDDIDSLTLYLKNNKYYEDYTDEINTFLYKICFNMLININVYFNIPYYIITSYTQKDNSTLIKDKIGLYEKVDMKLFDGDPANNFYKSIIETDNAIEIKKVKYERLFKILHNDNMVSRFMALYQYLQDLVKELYKNNSKQFKGQSSVIDYLYQCGENLNFENKNRHEDVYTHFRNRIAHAEDTDNMDEYVVINKEINIEIIRNLLIIINELIIKIYK